MTLRLTGGVLRSRKLRPPRGDGVRPTTSKVREALFSILGQNTDGWRVLDLFAGAGTLGLEAASRGAVDVVFVERDRTVVRLLESNAELLDGLATHRILGMDALRAIDRLAGESGSFDLVLLDPPYRTDLARRALERLGAAPGLLSDGCRIVVESDAGQELPDTLGDLATTVDRRTYGQTALTLYTRTAG
jgi:16S rRNA (guanine966-N2)-methyltransferase